MPKLIIKAFGDPVGDVYEIEHARYLLNFDESIILIEGQQVRSYDEIMQLVGQEKYKSKEIFEVVQVPSIQGG